MATTFTPAPRLARRGWGTGDYTAEIHAAIDAGHEATYESLLAEFRSRFVEIRKGSIVRFVANPGTHTGDYQVISIDAAGKALLTCGVICKLDRLVLAAFNPLED